MSPSQISMVVDPMGSGYGITHHIVGSDGKQITMTLQTPLDGNETPFLIGGKPTRQTYAGKRIDSRHKSGVIRMNGKVFGRSKAELSADGRTSTVENDNTVASGGAPAGKRIEHRTSASRDRTRSQEEHDAATMNRRVRPSSTSPARRMSRGSVPHSKRLVNTG